MNKLLLSSILLGLSAQVSAANLVINGSFEAPDIPSNTWSVHGAIPGWSTAGPGVEIRDNVVGTAFEGNQFIELDSHGGNDTNSSIFQTLNTEAGQHYRVSFAYSPRIGQPASTNGIEAFWNGALLSNVTANGINVNTWSILSFLVSGTGQDVLKFSAVGIDDSLGGNLDAISVNKVPLPSAAFLLAPVLVGFMALRRKS